MPLVPNCYTPYNSKMHAAFLRAILEEPYDDVHRLAFADWLDEQPVIEERPCPACSEYATDPENPWKRIGYRPERDPGSGRHEGGWSNCKTCNGNENAVCRGVVQVKTGFAERAEFIRVGCALTNHPSHHTAETGCPLRRRERELLWAYEQLWADSALNGIQHARPGNGDGCKWKFRRGFVEEITLTYDDFIKHAKALFSSAPLLKVTLTSDPPYTQCSSDLYVDHGRSLAGLPKLKQKVNP